MPIIESPTIPTAAEALTPASPARAPVEVAAIHPLRGRPRVRDWLQRDLLTPGDLIAPLLVQPDDRARSDWPALPTVAPAGGVGVAAAELWSLGVQAVKLFCHVTDKRPDGSAALEPGNPMVAAIRAVRAAVPDMVIATEVCGCAWTTTGECVVVDDRANTALDATYRLMADMAVLHAQAGADIIGPAAVLDGSIAAIRSSLDAAGHRNVGLTPSVIFHSVLFGPYKDGMGTNPGRGHRRGLQIDGCHIGQALDCAHRWLAEGADSLLVQPAMTSVDLLTRLRAQTNVPITAFSVSGEHELLGGHTARYVEYTQMLRRAGADRVMTYGAAQLAAAVATPVARR